MTPAERTAEARAKLWEMSRSLFHDEEHAKSTLNAFAAAVRAEAFEEVRAEAERRFEVNASEDPGFGPSAQAIAYGRLADWAKRQAEKAMGK